MIGWHLKRVFDLSVALPMLIFFSPVIFICALCLKFTQRSIFFYQERPGLHERPFWIIKFQTMTDRRDKSGQLLPDDQRLTSLGRFLRSTSIDELPQLINVLKGDLSIVGPRPLLMEYLRLYNNRQKKRHLVPPGITGWAQINGRNAISWEERFELDVWYVENWSFWLDLKIIILSVFKVMRREGINTKDNAPMPKFTGHPR